MMEGIEWKPTAGDKEWIFYREGMSAEEFEREYKYLSEHIKDLQNGNYTPLWKQRER